MKTNSQQTFARIFATNLLAARLKKGLTRQQLATASGLATSTVWNIENHKRLVRLETAYRLAEVLGYTVEQMLATPFQS